MNIDILKPLMKKGRAKKRGRKAKSKPIKIKTKTEVWYTKELLAISELCRSEGEATLRNLKSHSRFVGDALIETHWDSVKSRNMDMLFIKINGLASNLAGTLVEKEKDDVDSQLVELIEQMTTINIASILTDEALEDVVKDAVSANVGLIKSIPQQYFNKIESIVNNGFQNGWTYNQIQEKIYELGESTDARAKLIARDQIGKLNSKFNEARQTDLGIDSYKWSTSGDERVRDEHKKMDGKIVKWSDPPPMGHAGEDFQCRCTPIPILDSLFE